MLERSIPLTDYFSILSRAVATLNPNTAQARDALYGRARQMLVDQINNEPERWSEAEAVAELGRFDAATDRIESGLASRLTRESIDRIPRQRMGKSNLNPNLDASPPYSQDAPKFTTSRVALLGAVGLAVLLG